MPARLRKLGWDDDLAIEPDTRPPAPARDQILVEIEACGVCGRDVIDRDGRFKFIQLPRVPGHEAVGRVVEIGPDVRDWKVGDRVATMHRDSCGHCDACITWNAGLCANAAAVLGLIVDGGYARWLTAPQRAFYRITEEMDPALAAILHCTFGTAYRGLLRASTGDTGTRVLVTGANGGVGAAAVQIAARMGATVIAMTRKDGGDFHKRLPGGPVDVVLDCVGAATFNASLRSLKLGGRVVAIGNIDDVRVELNLGYVITRGIEIIGSSGADRHEMASLVEMHAKQAFDLPIHARLPLAEADRAQRMVRAGGLTGRIVIVP